MCFDSKREELLAAYHKNSLFSLSLNVNSPATQVSAKFGSYFRDSRNLMHVVGNGIRIEINLKIFSCTNLNFFNFSKKESSKCYTVGI